MRMITAIKFWTANLTKCNKIHPKREKAGLLFTGFLNRGLGIALWTVLFAIMSSNIASGESWWQKLQDTGKQVIDKTVDEIKGSSEDTKEQQPDSTSSEEHAAQPSYTKTQVKQVQGLLTRLGYNPGPIDGIYGDSTGNSIRNYQTDHNLTQTGIPSSELISHMRNTLSTHSSAVTGKSPIDSSKKTKEHSGVASNKTTTVASGETKTVISDNASEQSISAHNPVHIGLLLYKHAPDSFSDEFLLKMTKSQIEGDQAAYRRQQSSFKQTNFNHIFVFSRAQIEGRVPDFAAKELLPVYKDYLNSLAKQIPDRLILTNTIRLDALEYSNGVLKAGYGPFLSRENSLSMEKSNIAAELQEWTVLNHISNKIMWRPDNFRLPPFIKDYFHLRGRAMLALDRVPEIPPIAIEREKAEHMWIRPDCSPHVDNTKFLRRNFTKAEAERVEAEKAAAEKAAKECRARLARYSPEVKTHFEIEIERVNKTDRTWIIHARIIGADVYGTRQELLKTFAANDFTLVKEKLADQKKKEALAAEKKRAREAELAEAKRRKEALAAKKQAEKRRQRDAELAQMNILGVRLGMSVDEAESALRAEKQIQTVYRFSEPPGRSAESVYESYYANGLIFITKGERDIITLFLQNGETIVGVSRRMLADGLTKDALVSALSRKYGEPTQSTIDQWVWGRKDAGSTCLYGRNIFALSSKMKLVEGKANQEVIYKVIGMSADGIYSLAECSTALQVKAYQLGTAEGVVTFKLFNHSNVAKQIKKNKEEQKSRSADRAKDLDL